MKNKQRICLIVLASLLKIGEVNSSACSPGWDTFHPKCYKYLHRNYTFKAAHVLCTSINGRIAAPENVQQEKKINTYIEINSSVWLGIVYSGGSRWYYYGFSDQYYAEFFHWDFDGEFDVPQPNDPENQQCVEKYGYWYTLKCEGLKRPVVCSSCIGGRFGVHCQESCLGCEKMKCDMRSGRCSYGCASGYYSANGGKQCFQCLRYNFGYGCKSTCSEHCGGDGECNHITGKCNDGCKPGYMLRNKQWECTQCAKYTYGLGCSKHCSPNCDGTGECNHITGACNEGCQIGYDPPLCDTLCRMFYYGDQCVSLCSEHCRGEGQCHPVNGICSEGCRPGRMPGTCSEPCEQGRFGTNCSNMCDRCRKNRTTGRALCSEVNGRCLLGCDEDYTPKGRECFETVNIIFASVSGSAIVAGPFLAGLLFIIVVIRGIRKCTEDDKESFRERNSQVKDDIFVNSTLPQLQTATLSLSSSFHSQKQQTSYTSVYSEFKTSKITSESQGPTDSLRRSYSVRSTSIN